MEYLEIIQHLLVPVAHAAEAVAEHAPAAAEAVGHAGEGFVQVSTEIHEAAENDVIGRLGIDAKLFIAQVINFGLVLLVLWKFAYKPLLKLMDDRTKKIESGLKKAEEMDIRVKELETEKEEILTAARKEAREIVDLATSGAEEKRQSMIISAKEEVEKVVLQGKEQLSVQKTQMIEEAKGELADLIVTAALKVTGDNIDKKKAASDAVSAVEELSKSI